MGQQKGTAARIARRQGIILHYVRGSLMIVGSFAAAAIVLALIA